MEGPVNAGPPVQRQPIVDKNGTLTDYGHRLFSALWERTGGYDDDVFRALNLGFTGLSQTGQAQQQIRALEGSQKALQGSVDALRGDPRLEAGGRAERKAENATALAMSRAPAEATRQIEALERKVALLSAQVGATQAQLRQFMTVSQDQIAESVKFSGFNAGLQASQTQVALKASFQRDEELQREVDAINADFNTRTRAALSSTAPVTYSSVTGTIGLNATTTDIPEGTRLYYTDVRADARIAAAVGVSVQAYDADLTAFAAKTAPAGAVVGTTDVQTLTNKTLTSPAITTPTGIVKGDVGLGNVDNTSDANKPVSTATTTALNLKANLASPTLTGAVGINRAPAAGVCLRIQDTTDDIGIDYVRTASNSMALLAFDRNLGTYGNWLLAGTRIALRYEGGTEYLLVTSTGLRAVLTTYADNAAAVTGGLAATALYKTATGEVRVVV